ncbi:hypothetical protein VP01_1101g5 [Puccinia sorghi]|uniref:Uncharacterized protein n=1 Tax=Puccinia sorghi TaxID=27349 RepID=A0A0L6VT20_9BASI|nr:hypothetical protein VP01_1101g5 [Puccinia sorghi]
MDPSIELLSLGTPVKVLIKFSLFIPAKNKKDKKTWVGVSDQTQILVEYGLTSFGDLQNWVAVACNTAFANTGSIITKNKFQVDSHVAYLDWLETAVDNGKSEVNLTLTMPNPSNTIKRAAKEDLLAAHAAHQQAMKATSAKRKSVVGEDEEDDLDDEKLDAVD